MRRRTILGSAGSALSVALAGCGDLADSFDDSEDGGEENGNATESDGDDEASADGDDSESARESTDSDDDLYEDESIDGDVLLAEELSDALSARRHTFTWTDDPPGDECYVHVELENVGDDALETDMRARLFDEDGTELASTSYAGESSPEPGETDAYSLSLGNCEDAAAYEIEIGDSDEVVEGSESEAPETLIDDFETYDGGDLRAAWTLDGGGSVDVASSAALHEESTQGLRQEGDSNVRSFPGQGLANYPADGREVSILMRPDANTAQPWILVGMEDDVWSTETPGWRLIIDPGGSIRIARETGSGAEVLDEDTQLPSMVDETVDCRFVADSSGGFEFWIQDLDGSTLGYVSTAESEGIADEMSIGFRTTEGVDWDWLRLADDE
jgi:hypothetical protein